ncbi:hypothetical protein Avbf_07382, partial [Armadillidium vulgare]
MAIHLIYLLFTEISGGFFNNTFYEDGGPIFLMIGGEATAEANQTAIGSWITFGKKYKALFVQLEHRFYGESHPTR